jgi:hypothetical protein
MDERKKRRAARFYFYPIVNGWQKNAAGLQPFVVSEVL